ncbi:MAG: PD40 domain-containing protein [Bryobacteraceae bacterium]|nr:PD40 domain-containing protein [Bryobacteraceae bacterium]
MVRRPEIYRLQQHRTAADGERTAGGHLGRRPGAQPPAYPFVKTPYHEANAAFSPDGQWLAFTSNESGRAEVYIQALEKGETLRVIGPRHLVSRQGAQCLRWRSDGRELYYVGGDGWVYAAQVELRPAVSIGAPAPLFKISAEARAAIHALLGFDASADGSRFVIPVVTSAERPSLVVIQNWQSALEKRG